MFWRKKTKSFFDYFQDQSREMVVIAKLLEELFSDEGMKVSMSQQIHQREHVCDQITRNIIHIMNTEGFILPMDHDDILLMTKTMDDVIDNMDEAADSFAEIYGIKETTHFSRHLTKSITDGAEILNGICAILSKPSLYATPILAKCHELHSLEHEVDEIEKNALKNLYLQLKNNEVDIPFYIAWRDLYRVLESVTDKMDDVADLTEQIVMKYS